MDLFYLKTKKEIEKMLSEFWEDLEHIPKLKILLRSYPDIGGICKIEAKGINGLWDKIPLEQKKNIYIDQWKN
ncbi:hypothetical protein ES695_01945 [Candidatus Atribacteria bacterium 1244-E10-H5-B2]|nr:MAG: hypothetical protein ES695_01945 [Candidatus Atribacteria bacterium 1244-E10-H5-B2]